MKKLQLVFIAAAAVVVVLAGAEFAHEHSVSVMPTASSTAAAIAASTAGQSFTSVEPDAGSQSNNAQGANGTSSTINTSGTPDITGTGKAPAGPRLNVAGAAAEDLVTGQIVYDRNPGVRWPLASMTKLMTAEIVSDQMNLSEVITMEPADFVADGTDLTRALQPGDEYQGSDLLKVLLVPSSNEAADAFARVYGYTNFMAAMNAQATAWGLTNTHFSDPSGLSAANESTPEELLAMVRHVYQNHPEFFVITRSPSVSVEDLATGGYKQFMSSDQFAGTAGFLGGKTGTTPEAGDNLVAIFMVHGDPTALVVFGAANRYAATQTLLQYLQSS